MEHLGIKSNDRYAKRIKTCLCLMMHLSLYSLFFIPLVSCSHQTQETAIAEDSLVWYPGRTFDYKRKFNDMQSKQHEVASRIGWHVRLRIETMLPVCEKVSLKSRQMRTIS